MTQSRIGFAVEETGSNLDHQIGKRVAALRLSRGLLSEVLAQTLGVAPSRLIEWERGHRRIPGGYLLTLSQYFECSLVYFFEGLQRPESHSRSTQPQGGADPMLDKRAKSTADAARNVYLVGLTLEKIVPDPAELRRGIMVLEWLLATSGASGGARN